MKRAIIFDMDGTLFQTNLILESALESTFQVLRNTGLWDGSTPIDKYREIMGVPLPVVWETLCPNHSLEIRKKSDVIFQEKLIELIQQKQGALYPNTNSVLETLSKQMDVFIASNGQIEYLQAIVDTYNLQPIIKKVYSIQHVSTGNKSDLVKMLLIENNIELGFVVGDRLSDFKAAKDNDLTAIGVRFDFSHPEELKVADYIIEDLNDLLKII